LSATRLHLGVRRQAGPKRRSINETDFRAIAAAIMECFYKSGLSLDEAAAETIREMRLRHHTAAQVKKWREEMKTELPTEHLGVSRYRSLTADLDSLSPEAARAKAIHIVKSMR
jgi:hypothetical protein